jgi:hypothetical protein
MEVIRGEVEKVWHNKTTAGKRYGVIEVAGGRYSVWDGEYLGKVEKGEIKRGDLSPLSTGLARKFIESLTHTDHFLMSILFYLIAGIPRSLQIFFARRSLISVCLGTEDRLFKSGFHHHECLPPSLSS